MSDDSLASLYENLAETYRRVSFRMALLLEVNRDLSMVIEKVTKPQRAEEMYLDEEKDSVASPQKPAQISRPSSAASRELKFQQKDEKADAHVEIKDSKPEYPDRVAAVLELAKRTREIELRSSRPPSPRTDPSRQGSPRPTEKKTYGQTIPRSMSKNAVDDETSKSKSESFGPKSTRRASSVPSSTNARRIPELATIKPRISQHPRRQQEKKSTESESQHDSHAKRPPSVLSRNPVKTEASTSVQVTQHSEEKPPLSAKAAQNSHTELECKIEQASLKQTIPDRTYHDTKPTLTPERSRQDGLTSELMCQERFWAQLNKHPPLPSRANVVGRAKNQFLDRLGGHFHATSQKIPSVGIYLNLVDIEQRIGHITGFLSKHRDLVFEEEAKGKAPEDPSALGDEQARRENLFRRWYVANRLQRACAEVFYLFKKVSESRSKLRLAIEHREKLVLQMEQDQSNYALQEASPLVAWFNWWLPPELQQKSKSLSYLGRQHDFSVLKDGRRLLLYHKLENVLFINFLRHELQRILVQDFIKSHVSSFLGRHSDVCTQK
eukprot:TRINITY_DN5649_c0_g1_i8.p1 TRINITY_DN5649_c0_g1~~TRINITY_DN5649_c0_g1_i8.p1  ORF type:complete len:552 (+),score=89.22 TRINITY_DN5649_c0_g1_i8:112-1767(+)